MNTTHPRRPRSTTSSLLAGLSALLLAGGLLLASAAPAAAHDNLISTTPEAGSTVGESPSEISLTFSGELLTATSSVVIEVTSPDGQNVAEGEPLVDGTTVTQTLAATQSAGAFTVLWRVVSSDGHPISDQYTYTVEAVTIPTATPTPGATSESSPEPSPTATATEAAGSDVHSGPSGGGAFLPILAVVSGVVIVGGALVVVLMVARERCRRDRAAAAAASGGEMPGAAGQAQDRATDT
mgnify:CR=1 FL=1